MLLQGEKQYLVTRLRSAKALQSSITKNICYLDKALVEDTEGSDDDSSEEDVDFFDDSEDEGDILVDAALESANSNDVLD